MLRRQSFRFEEVKAVYHKSVKCSECGKKLQRQKTIMQTVNPFNRLPNGLPKTRENVREDVMAEGKAWQEQPEMCRDCSAKSKVNKNA